MATATLGVSSEMKKPSGRASLPVVRNAVRELLTSAAAYHTLEPNERREIARSLVSVCQTAVSLLEEEAQSSGLLAATSSPSSQTLGAQPPPPAPLAIAQSAGPRFSGVSAQRVADTTRAILNAVSFPRFVTELINGVFKALVDSNQQQMHAYVELIKNVAASTEGFADANLGPDRARQWLVETFPGSFTLESEPGEDTDPRDAAEKAQESRVRLKEGASVPSDEALRTALGIASGETVPNGDPESSLVPFARRALARRRQQMLATMVTLGMQRIVIESGRLNASMRFHIDTRSAANADEGSRFDIQNSAEASGKYGAGPWGVEAKMTNTIGYVSTQKTQTSEEMNTDLDLNSSVELYFKTDYVPLDRLAGVGQVDRIKVNTLNPDAEENAARQAREQRATASRQAEASRMSELGRSLIEEAGSRSDGASKPGAATVKPPSEGKQTKAQAPPTEAGKTKDQQAPPPKSDKQAQPPKGNVAQA